MMRAVALVLAFVLPPLAIWLMRGVSAGLWVSLALSCAALVVFWVLFAGPGVALWVLAGLQAAGVALFMARRTPAGPGAITGEIE